MAEHHCPICDRDVRVQPIVDRDGQHIECDRCGNFTLSGLLARAVLRGPASEPDVRDLLPFLSAYTRQASERGERVVLDAADWKNLALAHKATNVSRKVDKLVELIGSRSKPGFGITLKQETDPPLVDAESVRELNYLLEHLGEIGFTTNTGNLSTRLTPKGWEKIQSATAAGILGRCFVAMSFDDSLKPAYDDGIYPAIKFDCQMEPVRVDLVHHNEKICDKIIAEIRRCQFLVADFTKQKSGVYFEAGFAMGLGRPVIWMCKDDDFANVHFDTRQYNHIVWANPKELREKLADRIRATIFRV